jgi:hypothetical protein
MFLPFFFLIWKTGIGGKKMVRLGIRSFFCWSGYKFGFSLDSVLLMEMQVSLAFCPDTNGWEFPDQKFRTCAQRGIITWH